MRFYDNSMSKELITAESQDRVLLCKLSKDLSEENLEYFVNYVYHNRNIPVDDLLSKQHDESVLSEMTISDIDEITLWIKWIFYLNNLKLRDFK